MRNDPAEKVKMTIFHQKIRRLIVIQPHGIGDLIKATPMLSGIKKLDPDIHLSIVVGSKNAADVVRHSSLCDEVVIYNPIQSRIRHKIDIIKWLRKQSADACLISFSVSPIKGGTLALISGAKWRAGMSGKLSYFGYNLNVPKMKCHAIEGNIAIAQKLFPSLESGPMLMEIDSESRKIGDRIWKQLGFGSGPILGIHPGCDPRHTQKRYPIDKFAKVVNLFLEIYPKARVLLFFGPGEENLWDYFRSISDRVEAAIGHPLQVTADLLKRVKAFLTNDSGLGHVACAVGTPVASIFGPTDYSCHGPIGEKNIVISLEEPLDCQPCFGTRKYKYCKRILCLNLLEPEQILEGVKKIWNSECDNA